ncbi:transcriptional regulator, TetR family [Leptospira broomii serovar Hurstbridge str. 5399]|uniref:Transcriptional regulator, TetR family n=1 Tax=Leptospira broomii serovar Hurstbridge str. 5399 TaxID=1049789 RepID=T0FG46_9LEPT|nr:TetR family transcriptional regulator [Leptospira broomii]EQA46557.1 transcriptional regulator, TetR family [Leptospira broomii serovar Hurstbridge str. 5399]
MPRTGLSPEELKQVALDSAEKMIRKFGFDKTHLVDIAKEIGVSHPILYRLFPDKAALIDAVSERWLNRIDDELAKIVSKKGSSKSRLHAWFLTLHRLKREKVSMDPELYRAFNSSAELRRPIVVRHLETTMNQLVSILESGVRTGEFSKKDPKLLANLLFHGMITFHHPKMVLDHLDFDRELLLKQVLDLLLAGILRA